MNIIQALIYGIVQGITEFLPVSSTAHLVILQKVFFGNTLNNSQQQAMDVALHLGTTAAVILFFFKDWVRLISAGFKRPRTHEGKLFWYIVLATIPAGIIGLLFDKLFENATYLWLISLTLIVLGIVLYFADKYGRNTISLKNIGLKESLIIGVSQAIAMIPGVSRSGITITTGRVMGVNRKSAAKFTFLLSTPTMLGAGLYKMKDIIHLQFDVLPFTVAILSSAVVGALSIGFLLNYVRNKGFGVFAIYRCALGLLLIVLVVSRVIA